MEEGRKQVSEATPQTDINTRPRQGIREVRGGQKASQRRRLHQPESEDDDWETASTEEENHNERVNITETPESKLNAEGKPVKLPELELAHTDNESEIVVMEEELPNPNGALVVRQNTMLTVREQPVPVEQVAGETRNEEFSQRDDAIANLNSDLRVEGGDDTAMSKESVKSPPVKQHKRSHLLDFFAGPSKGRDRSKPRGQERSNRSDASIQKPSTGRQTHREQKKEVEARKHRDAERNERLNKRYETDNQKGDINWFWLSQSDIIPGFWATPWRTFEGLNAQTCIGAIHCFLEAITHLVGDAGPRYIEFDLDRPNDKLIEMLRWMREGKSTFPAYAYYAQGGIVCQGKYNSISLPYFAHPIPVIELFGTEADQVSLSKSRSQQACIRNIVELMRLDSWLSIVGRAADIMSGRSNLLRQTPALVQIIISEFEIDFLETEFSSQEGGYQVNKETALNILDYMTDKGLKQCEALYVLVAMLRTVKVGLCVLNGSDTRMLIEILQKDVQVNMV